MCGIAGILNLDGAPVSQPYLQKMTDAIAHATLLGIVLGFMITHNIHSPV